MCVLTRSWHQSRTQVQVAGQAQAVTGVEATGLDVLGVVGQCASAGDAAAVHGLNRSMVPMSAGVHDCDARRPCLSLRSRPSVMSSFAPGGCQVAIQVGVQRHGTVSSAWTLPVRTWVRWSTARHQEKQRRAA